MKITSVLYLALGALGLAAAVLVPLVIYHAGTPALPVWRSVSSPGPLSAAHSFLGTQCESCHTPNRGIEATACITCHAAGAPVFAKQSTAFHATIQECRGCHVEHQGGEGRPIRIDHSVLARIGVRAARAGAIPGQPPAVAATAMPRSVASVAGVGRPHDGAALDCVACHGIQDKHAGLFGQQCADCHSTETWKIAGFLHPSPRSEDCNQCHRPPASHDRMNFERMGRGMTGHGGSRVEQCYLCHQTDAFNYIKDPGSSEMR